MTPLQKTCRLCQTAFVVTNEDLVILEKISPTFEGKKILLPPPTLCPNCRQQRRLAFRNERKLYHRKCDKTDKEIISVYSSDKPCTIYDQQVWWSDAWDEMATGRDFDFNRPFFEQMKELSLVAPRPCIVNMGSENSLFTNHSAYNKNCYMCINTGYCEDLFYCSNYNLYSKNCTDCLAIQRCERCYFCTNTKNCSFSSYLFECSTCSECAFCFDCQSCENCFGCWNLRHKRYHFLNKPYSKEEYEKKLQEFMPKTPQQTRSFTERFWMEVRKNALHRDVMNLQAEGCTGDHLFNNKAVFNSYYTFACQDVAYSYDCGEVTTALDATEPFKGESHYETHACNLGYQLLVCSKCYESDHLSYCQYCWNSSNCFGCFGLKRKKYCIFNKQYTKEAYEKLVPRILEHMKTTGEYGEFFPFSLSPFGYNETIANEYYPRSQAEAAKLGMTWKSEDVINCYQGARVPLDRPIEEVPDEITKQILTCSECEKNYRLIAQELAFYRMMKLPLPAECPDCRHKRRMALRNPRRLWARTCNQCKKAIQTSYAPDRPEKVVCEECYLKEVY